jgi:hypothetical protein
MEIILKNTQNIILCGDHHSEYGALFKKIDHNSITDCLIIMVGDGGEGFVKPDKAQVDHYKRLNEEFKKRNIEYIAIRGNHSCPQWFKGQINYSNFKLIPDYAVLEINGEIWQFVGGAVSVDRKYRVEGRDYWRDETFVLNEEKAVRCDVLITHTAPMWIGPPCKGGFVQPFIDKDVHLYDELIQERKLVGKLFDICQPKKSFHGHFHTHEVSEYSNTNYKCSATILDILEFHEYRK